MKTEPATHGNILAMKPREQLHFSAPCRSLNDDDEWERERERERKKERKDERKEGRERERLELR